MSYEGDETHTDVFLRVWAFAHCKSVSSTLTKELEDHIGDRCKLRVNKEKTDDEVTCVDQLDESGSL